MQTAEPSPTPIKPKPAATPSAPPNASSKTKRSKATKVQISKPNKTEIILGLLRRKSGASVDEMIKATGWQAHSVRGFLSGTVKKKLGLNLVSETGGKSVRRYRTNDGKPA